MRTQTTASIAEDESVARLAVQAALTVLEGSGLKADGPSVRWTRAGFPEFREVLKDARRAISTTLSTEYKQRGLATKSWHRLILDTPDLLLMSAVQAWLAGRDASSIHPFSATSYTWLAVSTFTAMRHMEDECHDQYLDLWELDERERYDG